MRRTRKEHVLCLCRAHLLCLAMLAACSQGETIISRQAFGQTPRFRGALVTAANVTPDRIQEISKANFDAIVVRLEGTSAKERQAEFQAAQRVQRSSLALHYWIEVARCQELAEQHPEWMASLQTHDAWRRYFPDAAQPTEDEVVKAYPWVPILSREPFVAQLSRVKDVLANMPPPAGVFLNDLQGAPSACGCGNPLCRWTSDYGDHRTTTPLADDAAALFVSEVSKLVPHAPVVPVWTTECEKHDGAADGLCAGVGCFQGICWKAFVRQLAPIEKTCKQVAVFAPYRLFQRDLPIYGGEAAWIRHAIESFSRMPPRHGAKPVAASRLIAVLQGWDVNASQLARQIRVATDAGAAGYVVAFQEVEQDWQPKIVRWR